MDTPELPLEPNPVPDPASAAAPLPAEPSAGAAPVPRCLNHPGLDATVRCDGCSATVCDTCAFGFPGDRHLCPACAERAVERAGKSRRKVRHWALALALWALVSFVVFLGVAAVSPETDQAYGLLSGFFILFVVLPVVAGLILAVQAVRAPPGAAPVAVVALTLNIVVATLTVLLIIVGILVPE